MFTNDPKFRDDRITTTRRELIRSDCDEMMDKYGVGANQVVWLGGSSHYVPESRALVERFRAMNQFPPPILLFFTIKEMPLWTMGVNHSLPLWHPFRNLSATRPPIPQP